MGLSLHQTLVNSLDVLASSRSTLTRRADALDTLGHILVRLCVPGSATANVAELDTFLKLQDGFECNIASHLIHCVSLFIPTLQQIADSLDTYNTDTPTVSKLINQSLSILQGMALIHPPSKSFLSKKWCIQMFVDLLAISRHLSCSSQPATDPASSLNGTATLASSTIDTLLCVLVDAPAALRAFEEVDGVEAIVKTLKRTGVARDIRIKCLEFLYFYLLDETGDVPLTPSRKHKMPPCHSDDEARVAPHLVSSLNTSNPCSAPFESTMPSTPRKPPRNFAFLRKDLDFVPMTPQKKKVGQARRPGGDGVQAGSGPGRSSPVDAFITPASPVRRNCVNAGDSQEESHGDGENLYEHRRSTKEKKEILGSLLGNVDTLVEGVTNSGIWGLG